MAVRNLARAGSRLAAEQTAAPGGSSVARACPACTSASTSSSSSGRRRLASSSATSVQWPGATSTGTSEQRQQPSSSWAAIAKAGQAWYDSATSSLARHAPPTAAREQPTGAAQELVTLLKYTRSPDPARAWQLFAQADLEGSAHSLPLYTLHALLSAMHTSTASTRTSNSSATVGGNKLRALDVESSTAAARQYDSKVELIRLRIRQAGGATSHGDLNAMLAQYHTLRYAPGASKVWDEFMQLGHVPAAHVCQTVFETMHGWTTMHLHDGGRQVAKASAQPLVRKALSILADIGDDHKRVDAVLDYFFKIIVRAQDDKAFFAAMRQVYGFDVNYPGSNSLAAATSSATTPRRQMGEQQVAWVLEILADMGDLSKMVTVFEVFDSGDPVAAEEASDSVDPSFFAHSFHGPATTSTVDGQTLSLRPHSIGTSAFAALIREAGRQKNGVIMRHYFDELYKRWRYVSDERLARIEQIVAPVAAAADASETAEHVPVERPLGMPFAQPVRPYKVPATLVRDVVKYARAAYDVSSSRLVRDRTKDMLEHMKNDIDRLSAVLNRFEESDMLQRVPDHDQGSDDVAALRPPRSLQLLAHEIEMIRTQQSQLRQLYPVLVVDDNIVSAYNTYHNRSTKLVSRVKRIAQAQQQSTSSRSRSVEQQTMLTAHKQAVTRSRRKVIEARLELVSHRLDKLRKIGRAGKGRKTWDAWVAQLRSLKTELAELDNEATAEAAAQAESVALDGRAVEQDARLVSASAL
ncbi:hypothetical protein ACM66B_005871 [Microbotryomycetes sp. NB124-2]